MSLPLNNICRYEPSVIRYRCCKGRRREEKRREDKIREEKSEKRKEKKRKEKKRKEKKRREEKRREEKYRTFIFNQAVGDPESSGITVQVK